MSQGVTKIQELLAGMKVNNGDGGGEERLDELAKLLKTSLGVSYKNNDAYLELAKHMTKFSIANDDGPNDDGDLQVSYQQRRGRTRARDTAGTGEAKQTRSSSTQSAARNKTFMEHTSYSPSWHHQNDQSPAPKAPLRQEFPYPARRKSPPRYPSNNSKFLKGQNGSKATASPDEKKDAEQKLRHRPQKRDFSAGSSPPRSASPSHRYYTPSSPRDRNHSSSRSSSPFAARPGLQEGENGDSIAFSGRSPGRSTVHAASIPPAMPHIPNMSSGISSQHPSGVPHHQRSRSQGVDYDTESISQPQIPRPHSESPMRKPASTDDEGDQPLAQPHRAFSKSPRGNQCAGNDIQLPDLSKISIPDIGSKDGEADGLFTPPPRSANSSFVDDPMSAYPIRGSSGLKPRSAFPDHLFGTTSQRANLIPDRSPSPMEIDETETPPPAKPAFSLGQDVKKTRRPTVARKVVGNSSSSRSVPSVSNELAFINAKREEARSYFISKDYRSSIHAYTQALKKFSVTTSELPRDTFAVLLSNRAACLLMVGAFDAAVSDCSNALQNVKMPLPSQPFSTDGGLMLKVKLYTRLGRANLKIGKYVESMRAFEDAFRTSEVASGFSKENHSEEEYKQNWQLLSQLKTEASLGQSDAKRLKDACENLTESMQVIASGKGDRTKYSEALSHVNVALSMATGCAKLIESKLSILAYFKRWRETAGFCERLAACNVLFDGIFIEDLAPLNPFPGVSAPRYLKADFFKNTRDEDSTTRDLKLSSRASAEAILRLPIEIAPMYLRALRLEERYPAADSSIRSLEEFLVAQGSTVLACGWLSKEREKLTLTKAQREEADELFRNQEFQKASQKYMDCLSVDREGCGSAIDGLNAGGRLHAVLHCNRAACLMAMKKHHEAIEECTNALRIHGRYMKAILRRARCYSRLQQTVEAVSEYRRWLNLVEDRSELSYNAACIFDGPQDVKDSEISQVKKELDDVQKAKRRAEAKAQEESERRRAQKRNDFQENFSASWRSQTGPTAQQRRDHFYGQKDGGPRRWDSFANRGTRSNSNPRPRPNHQKSQSWRSNSQGRASPRSCTDHYATLDIPRSASEEDIKKAYRKMALKYHPDKNREDTAVENFRKVKLAHEVLSDPVKRREYDTGFRRPY